MYHWIKQKLFYVKNADIHSLKKECTCGKHQDCSQEQDKQPTSQSQSFPAKNADMLTQNSYQKKLRTWRNRIYSGLQKEIYE